MMGLIAWVVSQIQKIQGAVILYGYSGSTTRGTVYYIDNAGAVQAATPAIDLWGKLWGVGTGATGTLMKKGRMKGLASMTAGIQFVAAAGALSTTPGAPGEYAVGIAPAHELTTLEIDIVYTPPSTYA